MMKQTNNESVKISIIVTSYNYEAWIRETLDSLVAQTYKNFEIIVVDDGSTDNSVEVIKDYCKKDSRIRLCTHYKGRNRGLIFSTLLGLSKTTGEYVAFCESDDYWDERYLEEKVNYILNSKNEVGMIVNNLMTDYPIHYVDISAKLLRKHSGKNILGILLKGNCIPTFSCVMVKGDILAKCDFNSPVAAWLDYWLWMQILLQNNVHYIDKKLTYWRIHPSSYNSENDYNLNEFVSAAKYFLRERYPGAYRKYEKKRGSLKFNRFWLKTLIAKLFFSISTTSFLLKNLPNDYDEFRKVRRVVKEAIRGAVRRKSGKASVDGSFYDLVQKEKMLEGYYSKCNAGKNKFRILMIVHEFSLTGAPRAALLLAESIREIYGVSPVIISLRDGPMKQEFLERDFFVMDICENCKNKEYFEQLSQMFDLVIMNSWSYPFFGRYQKNTPPKIWWVHEDFISEPYYETYLSLINDVASTVSECWSGSPITLNGLNNICPTVKNHLVLYGTPDLKVESITHENITFLFPATIQKRKGQDIFAEAIKMLPEDVRGQAQFVFVGQNAEPDLYKKLKKYAKEYSSITLLPETDFESLMKHYAIADCIVVPSRNDPMPMVATYGFMMKKLCIISNSIGTSLLVEKNKNCIVFENENAEQLASILQDIIENFEKYKPIAENGRKVYEKYFSIESFKKNIKNRLDCYLK